MPGLGRKVVEDIRDYLFPMHKVLPLRAPKNVDQMYWDDSPFWGDQGQTEHCTGYGWTHWLTDGPVYHSPVPVVNPDDLYYKFKDADGESRQEDGSTVRTGAQVLQQMGFVTSYHWAYDVITVERAILAAGPVVVGTTWFADMFNPDANHIIRPTGPPQGGHCYVLNGYDKTTDLLRIKNSWGKSWGDQGHAYMKGSDFDQLLRMQGEACLAIETTTTDPGDPTHA